MPAARLSGGGAVSLRRAVAGLLEQLCEADADALEALVHIVGLEWLRAGLANLLGDSDTRNQQNRFPSGKRGR